MWVYLFSGIPIKIKYVEGAKPMPLLSELRSVISLLILNTRINQSFFLFHEHTYYRDFFLILSKIYDCGPWKWHSSVYSILEIIIY